MSEDKKEESKSFAEGSCFICFDIEYENEKAKEKQPNMAILNVPGDANILTKKDDDPNWTKWNGVAIYLSEEIAKQTKEKVRLLKYAMMCDPHKVEEYCEYRGKFEALVSHLEKTNPIDVDKELVKTSSEPTASNSES